jgi:hypothetical protein
MGIGIPISQSKRPLPIVFSSLVCPNERPLGSKGPAATSAPRPRLLTLPRTGQPFGRSGLGELPQQRTLRLSFSFRGP